MISTVARFIRLHDLVRWSYGVALHSRGYTDGSRSVRLVMALRTKLALGLLAGPGTLAAMRSIRTRGSSMLQRDPDNSEGH
jgi:hypothetical protein